MNLTEAREQLERAAADAERLRQEAVDEVGLAAVPIIRTRWPRDTGLSGDSFRYEHSAITNPVPYTSDVHDGLVHRLLPEVLAELNPLFAEEVELRLGRVLEG